jgi:transcription elongation factor Elf1
MNFKCPHCGKGTFTLSTDAAGSQTATCNNCNKATPFSKDRMTNPRMKPDQSRKLHLK